jgi:hypothetical protein
MKKRLREPVNGLTHLAGGLLACVGLLVLLASAGRTDQIVAFGIFGLSLVALYSASALYHLLPLSPTGVARLRRVDHMMIFVLIAGTYTPFCLLALDGAWRVGLLGVIWSLALCGVLLKIFWMGTPRWLSVALYLGMGGRDRGARPLPGGAGRRDDLGLGRGPTIHRGSAHLRSETPKPCARNIRIPRAVAPLRRRRKRLPLLGGAALPRPTGLMARA